MQLKVGDLFTSVFIFLQPRRHSSFLLSGDSRPVAPMGSGAQRSSLMKHRDLFSSTSENFVRWASYRVKLLQRSSLNVAINHCPLLRDAVDREKGFKALLDGAPQFPTLTLSIINRDPVHVISPNKLRLGQNPAQSDTSQRYIVCREPLLVILNYLSSPGERGLALRSAV